MYSGHVTHGVTRPEYIVCPYPPSQYISFPIRAFWPNDTHIHIITCIIGHVFYIIVGLGLEARIGNVLERGVGAKIVFWARYTTCNAPRIHFWALPPFPTQFLSGAFRPFGPKSGQRACSSREAPPRALLNNPWHCQGFLRS